MKLMLTAAWWDGRLIGDSWELMGDGLRFFWGERKAREGEPAGSPYHLWGRNKRAEAVLGAPVLPMPGEGEISAVKLMFTATR